MRKYLLILFLITNTLFCSCAFDQEEPDKIKLEDNYYILIDREFPQDGASINYSKDEQIFEQIANNCFEIYHGNNTIVFMSKSNGEKDTLYYSINTSKGKYPIQIVASSYNNQKLNLKPTITPRMK